MFLFLSKLLPIFVYPASLSGILLALAVATRRPAWRKRLLLGALLLIWLGGNGWVANALVKSLEWRYLPGDPLPEAGAIVVLGGGTQPRQFPRPSPEVDGAGDRVIYAARLFREGKAPLVVVTGGRLPWSSAAQGADAEMADLLAFMGVPPEAMLLEGRSANTYENAVFTKELLEPLGITRIILVTSALHMPRAAAVFAKQGFEVIPAPTDFSVTLPDEALPFRQAWPNYLFDLFPTADNLSETTLAMKEYLGILTYRVRGWL